FELVSDLAHIVIDTAREHRQQMTKQLATQIGAMRDGLTERLNDLARQRSEREVARAKSVADHADGVVHALDLEISEIDHEIGRATKSLSEIAQSQDALADRIAAAGLDMQIQIVEEHRPDRPEHRGFVIAMIAVIVGVGSLLGSALLIGAFDSRVHDVDDV